MYKGKPLLYISLLILVSCIFLLVTGSPVLNKPFIKGTAFPLGTIISWAGLIALSILMYFFFIKIRNSNRLNYKFFRFAFISTVVLASLWGIIGFLLAGNWAFTFQNQDKFTGSLEASRYFWIFTASLVLLPVILILVLWLRLLSKKLFRRL